MSRVVALGAWCDLQDPSGASPGGFHVSVSEFAVLDDGRRATIRDGLGFSSWARVVDASGHVREASHPALSRPALEAEVRDNVLIPDEGSEDAGEPHPYRWLAELLTRQGVDVDAEDLRSLPYTVEFSERLQAVLAEA